MLVLAASIGALLVFCSSIASLMAVFMGGGGSGLSALLNAQVAASIVGALVTLWVVAEAAYQHGLGQGLRSIWNVMPGWLVRSLLGVVSLFVVGELAIFLMEEAEALDIAEGSHVPLFTALSSACALGALYARGKLSPAARPR